MRGFELAICAWAWAPGVCTASSPSGEAGRNPIELTPSERKGNPEISAETGQRGMRKDLLTTDLKKYPKLCDAQRSFTENNGLALKDVRRAFCLDLDLGKEFVDLVCSELDSAFTEIGSRFTLFLLSRCVNRLKACENSPDLASDYLNSARFDEHVTVSFRDDAGLGAEDQSRIRMVLNGIFREKSVCEGDQSIKFEKFSVKIARLSKGTFMMSNYSLIPELVISAYVDVLLSDAIRQCFGPQAENFKSMFNAEVPRGATREELGTYRGVTYHMGMTYPANKLMFYELMERHVYSDYHDFTWRMLFEE